MKYMHPSVHPDLLKAALENGICQETIISRLEASSYESIDYRALGGNLIGAIDRGEDITVPLLQMLLSGFISNSSRMSLLGLYDKDSPSRLLTNSFLWLREEDESVLEGIKADVDLWMRCCLVHDHSLRGSPLQVAEGALGARCADALTLACGVKKSTAKRWLRGAPPGPRSRGCLYTFSSNLLDGQHIYLRHMPEEEFVEWWFQPLEILFDACPAEAHSAPGIRRMNVEIAMKEVWNANR